jgi:hypothetical protein
VQVGEKHCHLHQHRQEMDPHRVISVAAAVVVAAEEKPGVASGQSASMYEPNRPAKHPARPSAKLITNFSPNPEPSHGMNHGMSRAATALAVVIVRDVAVPIPASSAPRPLPLASVEITITVLLRVINPFCFQENQSPNTRSNRKVSLELSLRPQITQQRPSDRVQPPSLQAFLMMNLSSPQNLPSHSTNNMST